MAIYTISTKDIYCPLSVAYIRITTETMNNPTISYLWQRTFPNFPASDFYVAVNARQVSPNYIVKEGDVIHIYDEHTYVNKAIFKELLAVK